MSKKKFKIIRVIVCSDGKNYAADIRSYPYDDHKKMEFFKINEYFILGVIRTKNEKQKTSRAALYKSMADGSFGPAAGIKFDYEAKGYDVCKAIPCFD